MFNESLPNSERKLIFINNLNSLNNFQAFSWIMLEDEEPGEGYCTIFFAEVDNIHHTLKQNIKQYKSYLYTSHNVCSSFQ